MPRILFLFLLLITSTFSLHAQVFKYIGIEDGLSSRRVISIQQGIQDYMWILTHKGIDRYDGKYFNHYKLRHNKKFVNFYPGLNHLILDTDKNLWEYGNDGYIFRYNEMSDKFTIEFDVRNTYPELKDTPISTIYLDSKDIFWISCENKLVQYNTKTKESQLINRFLEDIVVGLTEGSDNDYYFATSKYIYIYKYSDGILNKSGKITLDNVRFINYIYHHNETDQLIVNTLLNGLLIYDLKEKKVENIGNALIDVGINTIKPYYKNPNEVLIATDGNGIYKLNLVNKQMIHFLKEDYQKPNKMNGSIIKDICIDKANRLWSVIYPTGITVYSEKYEDFEWIKHSPFNSESLVDDRVNAILQDSDGDIWFATCNGISCYYPKLNKWETFLAEGSSDAHNDNHIFISLCESRPRKILAGGYMSGTYQIDKLSGKVHYTLQASVGQEVNPDKYIRSIYLDRYGLIWGGGYYSLRSYDVQTKSTQLYHTVYPITCIKEKDDNFLWIGTINGLYTFNRTTKNLQHYILSDEAGCINAIYQTPNDSLTYIGTYGNGLFLINNVNNTDLHFNTQNSGLITNNIYSIVPNKTGNVFLGTENGLALFNVTERLATHWTKEQGMQAFSFNQDAAIKTNDGKLIFGCDEGAIIISDSMSLPRHFSTHMIFENLHIMYQTVHPNEPDSPLKKLLNETSVIYLDYNQNTFSLNVSSINYDNPSNILYSWKLEGFYDKWSEPTNNNLIRYTNLSPGNYNLKVRAHLLDNNQFLEERSIQIIVGRPYWLTFWAFLCYALLIIGAVYGVIRYQDIQKDKRSSDDKIKFFFHTAHDIRTPLTLIKAPLGEILKKERLSDEGLININLAIQNTDNLSDLANNLMNFQKEELYSSKVTVQKEELNSYVRNFLKHFENYAKQKEVKLEFMSSFDTLDVWIDRNKMDSILQNLLTNALKYTPKKGTVTIETTYNKKIWFIKISDTGIGIPQEDQKKLFKFLFRGSNTTNRIVSGSGIGMLLTYQLIKNHRGKISFKSKEDAGTSFYLSFPIKSNHYHYKQEMSKEEITDKILSSTFLQDHSTGNSEIPKGVHELPSDAPCILIAEDNYSLRLFLQQTLSDTYRILSTDNGQEAESIAHEKQPDLILSDIMMPIVDGHELCRRLKKDMQTSHIPIILLTALNDKEHILRGLECRADRYLVKPFDLSVLRANISNVLDNRNLIRKRLQKTISATLKTNPPEEEDTTGLMSDLDKEFIQRVTDLAKEGLGKGMNVDTLCAAVNMSRTSFYNKIKALTGIAPNELIRNIRMKEACKLLKTHRYSVTEVSSILGYTDPKYFTDTFKKYYGITPSTYMKQEKNG